MAQIDLLPEELAPKSEKKLTKMGFRLKGIVFAFGCSVLILAATWIGLSIELNRKEAQLTKIEEDWQKIRETLRKMDELSQQKEYLGEELVILRSSLKRNLLWSEKLAQIREIIPDGIWLTHLFLGEKEESKFLHIKGAVTSLKGESTLSTITKFVGSIKENKTFFEDFKELELKNLKKDTLKKVDIMTFEIILDLNPVRKDGSNG